MTTSEHVISSSALRRLKSNIMRRERRRYKHRLQAMQTAPRHADDDERGLRRCNNTIVQFVHVMVGLSVLAYARDLRSIGELVTCLVVWFVALYALLGFTRSKAT